MRAWGLLPAADPVYTYLSSFHRQPTVNGYSGMYPPSYLSREEVMRGFPDDRALARLRIDNVGYLVVHLDQLGDDAPRALDLLANRYGLTEVRRFSDGAGHAAVFLLQ